MFPPHRVLLKITEISLKIQTKSLKKKKLIQTKLIQTKQNKKTLNKFFD